MRYFLEFAYNGTRFFGFQRQPDQITVQERIEAALEILFRQPVEIVGCGRTDTGVHARQYFAHFDAPGELPNNFLHRLNSLIGNDIAIYALHEATNETAHARFDANSRSYIYHVDARRNPFRQETAFHFTQARHLSAERLHEAAALLLNYQEFAPFCKTHTDAKTRVCHLRASSWEWDESEQLWIYRITADRFLRGMIRLIVGTCLQVGIGQRPVEDIRRALDTQTPIKSIWSVPPQGLFLTDIRYPEGLMQRVDTNG